MSVREEWRLVPGYPGYEASSLGRLRSRHGLMSGSPDHGGYLRVTIGYPKPTKRSVHALVALAFLGPRPDGMEVDHIDGGKTNNRPDNLRYASRGENELHKNVLGNGNRGERSNTARLTRDQVVAIRAAYRPREVSTIVLARQYGVSQSTISQIITRRSWGWL